MNTSNQFSLTANKFFRYLFLQSKLFIGLALIFIAIFIYHYKSSDRIYNVQSLIQLDSPNRASSISSQSIDLFSGSSQLFDTDHLIMLYTSRSNMYELIKELQLNLIDESNDYNFLDHTSINLEKLINNINEDNVNVRLEVNNNFYNLEVHDLSFTNLEFDKSYEMNDLFIKVNSSIPKRNHSFTYYKIESLIKRYQRNFVLYPSVQQRNYFSPPGGLISVNYLSNDPDHAIKILNKANQIFIESNMRFETLKATSAIDFIDNRLKNLGIQLKVEQDKLKVFQENNTSLDIDFEVRALLESLVETSNKINAIDIEEASLKNRYTEQNPVYRDLTNKKNELLKQRNNLEVKIKNLPIAQQEYVDLYRNVEISRELYKELLNKKLSYSIIEASTIGNISVIDKAFIESLVSPNLLRLLIFWAMVGAAISITIILIRGMYFLRISNPAEIEDEGINIPISSVIPETDDFDVQSYTNAIESSVIAIESLIKKSGKKTNLISITSATASNGKSTLSRHIAEKLSSLNKKVLLIDADFKRGNFHTLYNMDLLSIEDIKNINSKSIENMKVKDNLYLIPRLKRTRESFQWINNAFFKDTLDAISHEFDIIIFDTAPILAISDTLAVCGMCDFNLLAVRHNHNKINEVHHAIYMADTISKSFDGIIYNFYSKPNGYYGMYQYYGNYNYQYYANTYLNNNYYENDN